MNVLCSVVCSVGSSALVHLLTLYRIKMHGKVQVFLSFSASGVVSPIGELAFPHFPPLCLQFDLAPT